MGPLYFAYGSNMSTSRLRARVAGAAPVGAAFARGWALRMNKLGRDGTAKANLVAREGERTWGVLFRLAPSELDELDRFEGGYVRTEIVAWLASGASHRAVAYRSDLLTEDPTCLEAYARHVLEGAREHALPEDWIRRLEALSGRRA